MKTVNLKDAKKIIKELQDGYEFSYNLYIAVLAHLETKEGKDYDKRLLNSFTPFIETFTKMQGKTLTDNPYYREVASMQYLEFYIDDVKYSYFLNHGDKEIKISEFKRLNTNHATDENRCLDCRQILQNTDNLKSYVKHIKRVNESMQAIKDLCKYGEPMDTVEYYLREQFLNKDLVSNVTGLR